jgi:hypothetical protein
MLGKKRLTTLGTLILSLSLCFGAASAQAASACKGSEKSACERRGDCTWVKGYKRKDGVQVASHCKSKPKSSGKSSDKTKTVSKKSDSKEKPDKK